MKLVSVIIPCYNQGEFLEEALDSVLKQTYKNTEIIIVNDGSDDHKTIKILNNIKENISLKGKNIKIIPIENSGVCIARNIGINNSNGYYILPLDGDDKIENTYIEKSVKVLEEKSNVDIVYCIAKYFGDRKGVFSLQDFSEKEMLKQNLVFSCAMYRKRDFEEVGGYNSYMIDGHEDWDFWLSMIEKGKKFHRINEVLFYYRIKNISRNSKIIKNIDLEENTRSQIFENHKELYKKFNITTNSIAERKTIANRIINKIRQILKKSKLYFIDKKNSIFS